MTTLTTAEILEAAKEAMRFPDGAVLSAWMPSLERFAAIIERKTIEKCAVVCETQKSNWNYCAAEIRKLAGDE